MKRSRLKYLFSLSSYLDLALGLKPDMHASEDDIINTAKKHLASYQKPKSVKFIDELPKAPTGKILKRNLRDPYWEDSDKEI